MKIRSYGMWESPVTEDLVVQGAVRPGNIVLDDEDVYWSEARPEEGGRTVICRALGNGNWKDVTPEPYNVRTRVHEYGGGAFTVHTGVIYFVNFTDQCIYKQRGDTITALTPPGIRFADLHVTPYGLVTVAEREQNGAVENFLALVDLANGSVSSLAEGHDFFASPVIQEDRIAWLTWDHPDMPWNATELWTAKLSAEGLTGITKVAGGGEESIFQPQWSPDKKLYFVSDRGGWWNFYVRDGSDTWHVLPMEAEFAVPQWVFRMSTWDWRGKDIITAYAQNGQWYLAKLQPESGDLDLLEMKHNVYTQIRTVDDSAFYLAASPSEPIKLYRLDLDTREEKIIRSFSDVSVDPGYVSAAQPVSYPSGNGRTAHGFYYPPKNRDFQPPPDELPPLIVKSHGGPTAATTGSFNLKIQYWTTRGFAVLDVNYGGSTGYGKAYRDLLLGNWGIVDVDDCAKGAEYLVNQGLVDPGKLAVTGGSAGGFTTLACLAFKDTFTVGASHYGVSDLETLARDTHKFESRYLDRLVGPYPGRKDLYQQRSPIHHVDRLNSPVIFFQGLEDMIVPPSQAETMAEALKKKGIKVEYITYEGEQHGFRQSVNIKDSLKRELSFYRQVFSLTS
jgi:dipeptidyl aminopeptidase/acylaminoacyl peptidase